MRIAHSAEARNETPSITMAHSGCLSPTTTFLTSTRSLPLSTATLQQCSSSPKALQSSTFCFVTCKPRYTQTRFQQFRPSRRVRRGISRKISPTLQVEAAAVSVDIDAPTSVLVDKLLSLVEGTDRGTQIGEAEKAAVNEIVAKLETLCIPEPLESPLLFGEWDVVYSSNPTAPGGYYRSMLGRALLKTRDMVQTISAPDAITNQVAFAAFALLDGQVTLQGKLTVLDKKWVEVEFTAPTVKLGSLQAQYGGTSSVKLSVIFLDEVVRIGRGSRGSLFIFKRRT